MFENKDSKPLEQQPFSGEFCTPMDFLGGASGKELSANAGDRRGGFLGRQDPLEQKMATHSSVLA